MEKRKITKYVQQINLEDKIPSDDEVLRKSTVIESEEKLFSNFKSVVSLL